MQKFNQSVETLPRAFGNGVSRQNKTKTIERIDSIVSLRSILRQCHLRLILMLNCMQLYIKLVQHNIIIILQHRPMFHQIGIPSVETRRHPTRGFDESFVFFLLFLLVRSDRMSSDAIVFAFFLSLSLSLSYETIYSNKSANDKWFLQARIFV